MKNLMTEPVTISLTHLAHDLSLPSERVETAVRLLDEGHPIPFIARYRKDATGNLDEEHLRAIADRLRELRLLTERKQTILRSIESLGKLTPELEKKIRDARTTRRLEDLYLPYKPKKQTLAAAARLKGLEELADEIVAGAESCADLEKRAADFVSQERGVASVAEALLGAGHIISEQFSEKVELRQKVREIFQRSGRIVSKKIENKNDAEELPETLKSDAVKSDAPAEEAKTEENAPETPVVEETSVVEKTSADVTAVEEGTPDTVAPEIKPVADTVAPEEAKTEETTSETPVAEETASEEASQEEVKPEEASIAAEAKPEDVKPEAAKGKNKKKGKKTAAEQKSEQEEKLYSDYFDFTSDLRNCPSYRILAINRGERAKVLRVKLEVPVEAIREAAKKAALPEEHTHGAFLSGCVDDALDRLILPSMEREIRRDLTDEAEKQAVKVFAKNLRNLLLQKPLFRRRVLAVDPGFRYGCKLVALDEFGNFLAFETVYITGSADRRAKATGRMAELIEKYNLSVIAIGNGTGCREAEDFVAKMIAERFSDKEVAYIIVNEAGASVYSVSPAAKEEFPHYDALVRGAVSIGRRLQDPLNELVKIDPASLGIGIYQHDLKAKHLRESLSEVVESSVNYVGVDLNCATPAILKYVAGLNQLTAKRIYEYRVEHGPFRYREELKSVPGFGETTYTNAAGFLKIRDGYEPLDTTWIHPESYALAEKILAKLDMTKEDLKSPEKRAGLSEKIAALSVKGLADEFSSGIMTIADILDQFKRPGRDPREALPTPIFKKGVMKLEDLTPGMELMGTVLNVVDFGAFVDIGLHDSGLIHISRMGDHYVRDAHQRLAVGDIVKVWVVEVDQKRRRISLSMLAPGTERSLGRPSREGRDERRRSDARPQGEARPNADGDRQPPRRNDSADGTPRTARPERRRDESASGDRPRPERREGDRRDSDRREGDRSRGSSSDRARAPKPGGGSFGREGAPREGNREERTGRREERRDDRRDGRREDRRGGRFDSRERAPRTINLAPTEKNVVAPISDQMKKGKEPMRSFSDLAQLFGRVSAPVPSKSESSKAEKPVKPPKPQNSEPTEQTSPEVPNVPETPNDTPTE